MKKYNLSEIMHKAWKLYRKGVSSFAEALHRAWNSAKAAPVNAQRIEEAQQAAGITEPVNTWAGWKAAGYMVEHGAKASVSGGADPQQQGRRPDLPGIVLRCITGAAAGSAVKGEQTMKTEITTKELEEAMNAVLKQARKMEESDEPEERRHGFGMESALTALAIYLDL